MAKVISLEKYKHKKKINCVIDSDMILFEFPPLLRILRPLTPEEIEEMYKKNYDLWNNHENKLKE